MFDEGSELGIYLLSKENQLVMILNICKTFILHLG
jgi:hypothetical protein